MKSLKTLNARSDGAVCGNCVRIITEKETSFDENGYAEIFDSDIDYYCRLHYPVDHSKYGLDPFTTVCKDYL